MDGGSNDPYFYDPPAATSRYRSNRVPLGDEEVILPWSIIRAIDRSPRYAPVQPRPGPKAFADPRGRGYGSELWPFDIKRAYQDVRYRTGIRNALNGDWTASNWKFAARSALLRVLNDLLALDEMAAWERQCNQ